LDHALANAFLAGDVGMRRTADAGVISLQLQHKLEISLRQHLRAVQLLSSQLLKIKRCD
jgi:hypothetical protein